MGVASYLERVPPVMDTPVYRVPQFEQLMMTLLYRVMVVSWRSVLAAAVVPVLRFSNKQARAPIWSGSHEHVFLGGLRCASDSELAAAKVEHSVAIRVTSPEYLQFVSTRRVLHRLLRICNAYDVVVDIWVSIRAETGDPATTAAVDDLTVLRTSREE